MNFRITTFLFALLLSTLWIFGLMIAHKRSSSGDKSLISPTLGSSDAAIDKVTIAYGGKDKKPDVEFVQISDIWYHKSGELKARIDGVNDDILDRIRQAKHEETADTS